jgi:hypothetical protein
MTVITGEVYLTSDLGVVAGKWMDNSDGLLSEGSYYDGGIY